MKRTKAIFCTGLVLALLLCACVYAFADEPTLADEGWNVANDNYLGWTLTDGVITGDFNIGWENAEPISLWQDKITDFNNFSIELDLTAGNATSPFIAVMGVRIEADGNGGDGNQVYLKSNNTVDFEGNNVTYDWLKAAGCEVHVTITRIDGGDLQIQLLGASNEAVSGEIKTLSVPVTTESAELTIGVYRGCAKFAGLTVREGEDATVPTEPAPTEPAPTEPSATEPAPTEPKATEPAPTAPIEEPGNDSGNTLYIVLAAAAVVIAAVVIVVVKKKK